MGSRPVQPTAEYVLERLQEGNAHFVRGELSHPHQDVARRDELTGGQFPFTTIFGCADSRTPPEHIFDLGLGDAFVVRTAGQVLDDGALGSLEYSITQFKAPVLIIMGHQSCGAVQATCSSVESGQLPGGFITRVVETIQPTVLAQELPHGEKPSQHVNEMVRAHTSATASCLLQESRIIADAVARGETIVLGYFYHLDSGAVDIVFDSREMK